MRGSTDTLSFSPVMCLAVMLSNRVACLVFFGGGGGGGDEGGEGGGDGEGDAMCL